VPSGGGSPTDVVTGIYALTISTESDSCVPRRVAGDVGQAPVQAQLSDGSAGLTVDVITLLSRFSIPLPALDGYSWSSDPFGIICVSGAGAGTMSELFQLLDVGDGVLTVSSTGDYTITGPCHDGPNETSAGLDGLVPQASCHSERTLRYSLRTPCPAPKRIVEDPGGLHCVD
jgi:hypothetical protein